MSRGGGRRVVKALDSPHTAKGCIMRASLIFFYLFISYLFIIYLFVYFPLKLPCTAYSLQVLQMCDRMFVLLSPTQGAILDRRGWSSGGASRGESTRPAPATTRRERWRRHPSSLGGGGGGGGGMPAHLRRVHLFLFSHVRERLSLFEFIPQTFGAALTGIHARRRRRRSTSEGPAAPSPGILNNVLSFMNLRVSPHRRL